MTAFDVTAVGLYCLDVLARPVRAIPQGGGADFIEEIRLTVAGTAGGTVIDCAKLGMKALAVGAVGEDEKGRFVLSTLQDFGVNVTGMKSHRGVHTATSVLPIRTNGERPCLHVRGASDVLDVQESDYQSILDTKFLHMGGNGLLGKMDGEPTRALLAAAKAANCITTFDLIFATRSLMTKLASSMEFVDYFVPSIEEATELCGEARPEEASRFFHDLGVKTCVFTMGGEGCFVSTPDTQFKLPAHDIEVVDTTGCGDAFTAGLIAALHRGWDIEQSVRFAGTCGALVAGGLGSDAGIIDFEKTKNAMSYIPLKRSAGS
jgi:sugar/nucleoside kinase (ribokinase family)